MKVLFVAPSGYLLGGVQDWLSQLVPAIRRHGVETVVAVPHGDQHDYCRFHATYPELQCVPFRNPTGSRVGRIRCLSELLATTCPDIAVGVNIADLYPAVRSMRLNGRFHGRVAMTIHAIESEYFSDLASERGVIDAVIVTNRLACKLASALSSMPAERILYAPYGVPVPAVCPRLRSPVQRLRIAWVGRLEQNQKRVHDLPQILLHLDQCSIPYELTIAGDGPERDRILDELEPWSRRGTVRYLGRLNKQQLQRDVFQGHHALLITSSWETGPIVAWEAVAAGMVVTTSAFVGCGLEGALLDERTALMFPVGDCSKASLQLARLHRDPPLYRRLRDASFSLVSARYSCDASIEAWENALRSILILPPLPIPEAVDPHPPSGRLDRWLGISHAETLRRLFRLRFHHSSPGGEWPHSLHGGVENAQMLTYASRFDRHDDLLA